MIDPEIAPVSSVTDLDAARRSTVGRPTPTIPVTVRNIDDRSHRLHLRAEHDRPPPTFTVTNGGILAGVLQFTFPAKQHLRHHGRRAATSGSATDGELACAQPPGDRRRRPTSRCRWPRSSAGTADSRIRVDVTVSNRGATALTGQALLPLLARRVRAAGDLHARRRSDAGALRRLRQPGRPEQPRCRAGAPAGRRPATPPTSRRRSASTRVLPDGATFGYPSARRHRPTSLGSGLDATLFTGARTTEVSILGMYSLVGAKATLTLVAPDGTVARHADLRRSPRTRSLAFNPAASAFGVDARAGRRRPRRRRRPGRSRPTSSSSTRERPTSPRRCPSAASTERGRALDRASPERRPRASSPTSTSRIRPPTPRGRHAHLSTRIGAVGAPAAATLALAPAGDADRSRTSCRRSSESTAGQGSLLRDLDAPVAAAIARRDARPSGDYGTFAARHRRRPAESVGGERHGHRASADRARAADSSSLQRGQRGHRHVDGFKRRRHPGRNAARATWRRTPPAVRRTGVRRARRHEPGRRPRSASTCPRRDERLRMGRRDRRRHRRLRSRRRSSRAAAGSGRAVRYDVRVPLRQWSSAGPACSCRRAS